jgi:hypothetical protein
MLGTAILKCAGHRVTGLSPFRLIDPGTKSTWLCALHHQWPSEELNWGLICQTAGIQTLSPLVRNCLLCRSGQSLIGDSRPPLVESTSRCLLELYQPTSCLSFSFFLPQTTSTSSDGENWCRANTCLRPLINIEKVLFILSLPASA